jgi:hypothetical protein
MSVSVTKSSGLRALGASVLIVAAAVGMSNPAEAAVDHVGWVWADNPTQTTPYPAPAGYSYSSVGGAMTITRNTTGSYTVSFAKLYSAGGTSDVQVTAYETSGYCMIEDWGTTGKTVNADVLCFSAAGAPADTEFNLLFQERFSTFGSYAAGLAFLWANEPTTASYTPAANYQYNSQGGTNTITRSGTGEYIADIPDLDPKRGDVQVTAYGSVAARCKVASWYADGSTGTDVSVVCFNSAGAAADEKFDLAYAVNESFGRTTTAASTGAWVYAELPTSTASYTPTKAYQYNGFATGELTAEETDKGNYAVTIPGSPTYSDSDVLVTAYGSDNGYCNSAGWSVSDSTLYVACFKQGGAPASRVFDAGYQTAK